MEHGCQSVQCQGSPHRNFRSPTAFAMIGTNWNDVLRWVSMVVDGRGVEGNLEGLVMDSNLSMDCCWCSTATEGGTGVELPEQNFNFLLGIFLQSSADLVASVLLFLVPRCTLSLVWPGLARCGLGSTGLAWAALPAAPLPPFLDRPSTAPPRPGSLSQVWMV